MSDPGPSRISGGLTKNSSIECTVDDLQEGLLVVSFFHKDNLFQGVLLQLNRERGIPAGISFPKDYFTGEGKKEVELNPTQVSPINQRNTYFQDTTNGRQSRSLRRVIKTPARFKNSRISLRPVHRPILCAKCGALCEDKSLPQTPSNTNKDSDKPKKNGSSNGITGKKIQAKAPKSEQKSCMLNLKATGADEIKSILPVVDDPQDYNYQSIGNHGIVDNAWKRPLAKPLKIPIRTYSSSKYSPEPILKTTNDGKAKGLVRSLSSTICSTIVSSTSDKACFSSNKSIATTSCYNEEKEKSSLDKLTLTHLLESQTLSSRPVFRITRAPIINSDVLTESTDKKKANNLKLCISKLTTAHMSGSLQDDNDHVSSASGCSTSNSSSITESLVSVLPIKAQTKGSKTRLKKRNSTVPLRSPDQSSIKTRKASTYISNFEYDSRTSDSDLSSAESDNLLSINRLDGNTNQTETVVNLSSGSYVSVPELSAKLSDVDNDMQPNSNSNKPSEPTKTPVIKITFGSCGNGMVVQIPPRTTQQIENTNLLESKAARKAMKKAKKEARKKHSGSRESSPSKIALVPLTFQSNINQSDSELPPILNPELPNLICDEVDLRSANELHYDDPSEPPRITKKRKKDKKRKKVKEHKENDAVKTSGGESLDTSTGELSSPTLTTEEPITNTILIPKWKGTILSKEASSDQNNTQTESHQRVCISLKRLTTNAYIPWNSNFNCDELETTSESTENEEPHDFPVDTVLNNDEDGIHSESESLESYNHVQSNHNYRKGDVVWGKSIGISWWPGKILDILLRGTDDVRAKVAWYKSPTQSFIAFNDMHPFEEYFDIKYTKSRRRGSYQQAVREALIDAHQLNPEDLPND